jgi:hypothetical protein
MKIRRMLLQSDLCIKVDAAAFTACEFPPRFRHLRMDMRSPVAATATPITASAEQQNENNDDQDQFHGTCSISDACSFTEQVSLIPPAWVLRAPAAWSVTHLC